MRPSLLNLSEVDRRQLLAEAAKSTDPDFRDACRAVLLLGSGQSRPDVAAQFDVHAATVGRWATSFRQRGVDGLRGPEQDRRGRPRKLQTQDLEWLRQTVLTSPRQLGYAFTNWTLPRLARYLKQQRTVKVQPHYLGLLLRRMGLSRQRPKHVLRGKRDEQAHSQAKAELEQLKKTCPKSHGSSSARTRPSCICSPTSWPFGRWWARCSRKCRLRARIKSVFSMAG